MSDAPFEPLQITEVQRSVTAELDRIAPVIDDLGRRFAEAGHELALVGGPVRDAMLGRLGTTTSTSRPRHAPEQTERLLEGLGRRDLGHGARRSARSGAARATGQVEITTYRSESYDPDSRKPDVDFGDTLGGDLGRRDFTVNAMAVRLPGRELEDPYGGVVDLAHRVLRTPGRPGGLVLRRPPADDARRALRRPARASPVDPAVVEAMRAMAGRIEIISAERVRDELVKLVCAPYPRLGLTLLVETGLAEIVLPELPALALERDEHHRHKDVYEHTLTVLEQAIDLEARLPGGGPDFVIRLRRADARRRQAADPALPRRRHGHLPPPRRGRAPS